MIFPANQSEMRLTPPLSRGPAPLFCVLPEIFGSRYSQLRKLSYKIPMKKAFPLIFAVAVLGAGFLIVSLSKRGKSAPPETAPIQKMEQVAGSVGNAEEDPAEAGVAEVEEPTTFATPPRAAWPQETGDIPASERATFGTLDNGLRYVIIPNAEPPKRASIRLHIDAGSLNEADDQRGVAHFLEHMVFNGSKNFPDSKELIPRMQKLGIAFGAHANAYTSFDETVYMLDLPNLAEPTLKLAYDVMEDFADGALLRSEEIDKERGVILSEKNSRDSVQTRLMEQQFEFLIPNSLITHRFPIGIEEVIKSAVRERFVSFYDDYYIPRNMTFVVVGDVEVEETEKRIEASFASMKNPSEPAPEADLGEIPKDTGFRAVVFSDPEVTSDDISLLKMTEATVESDSVAVRLKRMPLAVAHAMLNRRFSILAKKEDSPIQSAQASKGVWFQAMEYGSIDLTAAENRWKEAVPVLEQEFRRASEYGFNQSEFNEIKANLLNAYEQAVEREATTQSPNMAMAVIEGINSLTTFSSPKEDLRIAELAMAELTPETCHQAFKEFWDTPDLSLIFTTAQEDDTTQPELLRLYEASKAQPVQPLVEEETAAFAYTVFGEGSIESESRIEDLDITQLVLSNQIRVNFKRTEFSKNSVSLVARFGSGKQTMPSDKPGLDRLAGALLNAGGLGKHSEDDLQRIFAGINVGAGFGISDTAMSLSGRTTPDDLEQELQLMCAYLTDPGFRGEALRQFRKALPDMYDQLKHDLGGAQMKMSQWLYSDDPRYSIPTLEDALAYGNEDVMAWVMPQLKSDYLELSVVGDFDPEALKASLLKTFGGLPARDAAPKEYPEALKITFPKTPQEKAFTYESKIPKAAAMVMWQTPGIDGDIKRARRFNVLADVLSNRMREKIREELGATYSPQAQAQPSDAYPDFGYLFGFSIAKPEDLDTINTITVELGSVLAAEGASADELERSLNPIISQLETVERDNGYWLGTVMARSQAEPDRIQWAIERNDDYKSITLEEINELAAKYLTKETTIQVKLMPE